MSVRTEPRFTRDADLAVAVEGDDDVESLVFRLRALGYEPFAIIEHQTTGRIATVRLGHASDDSITDLMFASTGIEAEIVAAAELLDVAPPSRLPVAITGHLIAMKLLSRADDRPLDDADLLSLGAVATEADWRSALEAVGLITQRGFHRGRDLAGALSELRQRLERISQSITVFVERPREPGDR